MLKCYELVRHDAILLECRANGYPMRMAFMLVQMYQQLRSVYSYSSYSVARRACQGILAGCTHATTLLMVLLTRSIRQTMTVAPQVQPKDLVDDVALCWVGNDPSGVREMAIAT
eukprot:2586135-Pyramimonas_sp.AAC.1